MAEYEQHMRGRAFGYQQYHDGEVTKHTIEAAIVEGEEDVQNMLDAEGNRPPYGGMRSLSFAWREGYLEALVGIRQVIAEGGEIT